MPTTGPGTTPDTATLAIPDKALSVLFDAIHQDPDTATDTLRRVVASVVATELRAIAAANTVGDREYRIMPSDLLRIADEHEQEAAR